MIVVLVFLQPMPQIDHNGDNFHYRVYVRNTETDDLIIKEVTNWQQGEISVPSAKPFTKYEAWVRASNVMGITPETAELQKKYVFSGEEGQLGRIW